MFCAAVLAREDGSLPCSTAIIWQCQAAISTENSRTVLSRVWNRLPCCQRPARDSERAPPGEHTRVPTITTDEDRCTTQINSNNQMVLDGGSSW